MGLARWVVRSIVVLALVAAALAAAAWAVMSMPQFGAPMTGARLERGLQVLADHFDELAMPRDGRYVREPARWNENGITSVPPARRDPIPKVVAGTVIGLGALMVLNRMSRQR